MAESPTYNAAADLIERNLEGRARRKDSFYRRSRRLQLCRARRPGEPVCQSRAPARHSSRAADPSLPARHDRFSDRLSRRDQGRGRSGRGQHPAVVPTNSPSCWPTAGPARSSSRRRCCRRCRRRWPRCRGPGRSSSSPVSERRSTRSPTAGRSRRRVRYRADPPGRAMLLALFVGLDRPAEGHGAHPFEPDRRRRSSMRSRFSALPRATSCSRRQSCSSPMGSAMR